MTRIHAMPANHRRLHPSTPSAYQLSPTSVQTLRRLYREMRRSGVAPVVARSAIVIAVDVGWGAGFADCSRIWHRSMEMVAA